MESNLRFPGPETMETKIFGRLSAWQNWIFQRPNAVGERGAPSATAPPTARSSPSSAPERQPDLIRIHLIRILSRAP